ncbi:hypothetical protein [uncultured Desulfuromusa sp.]|uniref:hypothetical protein n=1 Tax=uncultured Desulfuromusa sp. TaxID=219183 RepID=UPI002AA78971|nr:hypothetical protein [uncultured Desulfuromusa sp.]
MSDVKIFKNSSEKPFETFLEDLTLEIEKAGFSIENREKSDLIAFYRSAGVDIDNNYKHVVLQICKPERSGQTLPVNPERCVFLQKFIFVYNKGGRTEVRFLGYSAKLMGDLLGHNEFEKGASDDMFAAGLNETFLNMEKIVSAAV